MTTDYERGYQAGGVSAAVEAFKEVSTYSETITPKQAFEFIDAYKAETGHRPSLSAMTLLYLREKARANKQEANA